MLTIGLIIAALLILTGIAVAVIILGGLWLGLGSREDDPSR